jgi:hypothetical protein
MTVLLPSKVIDLPGGYRWSPQLLNLNALQAHVLKHPLGLWATRELGAAWDHEGWSRTTPPVVDAAARDLAFEQIRRLGSGGPPCGVAEVFGAAPSAESREPECYQCPAPLVEHCAEVLSGTRELYAQQTEAAVTALQDGVIVARASLAKVLSAGVKRAECWRDAVVMAAGRLGRAEAEGVRITTGLGVRVELKLHQGDRLAWRTTYRLPLVSGRSGGWGYLLQTPAKGAPNLLSDAYVVPRAWWETHGN